MPVDSRLYWIWLQQAMPLGAVSIEPLMDHFGSAAAVYGADETALSTAGVRGDLRRRLADKSLTAAHRILDRVLELGDWVLTPEDALYPLSLRQIPGYPLVLYCRGVMPPLDSTPAITVVGTRRATAQGCNEARALAAGLAAGGAVVVSGGAVGIDAAVHTGALDADGRTVAVLGCPLDEEYPAPNTALRHRMVAAGSVLVSEYPAGEPYRCDFHVRNRLLVGLSQAVCLAQTPVRSGARITARLAREQGRDVYAMPGSLTGHGHDGGHKEIQIGATLVVRATDILQDVAPLFPGMVDLEAAEAAQRHWEKQATSPPDGEERPRKSRRAKPKKKILTEKTKPVDQPAPSATVCLCPPEVSPDGAAVFAALTATPQPVDLLADATGLPMPRLLAALTELEMFGCAVNSAGGQYRKV